MARSFRDERAEDAEAVRAVHLASFPTPAEADLVGRLRAAGRLTVSVVADLDGAVVGHVGFSPVSTPSGGSGVGLAPLAVLDAWRRRGIGAGLVSRGLEACADLGVGWVVVLGDPHYYARFGFRPASTVGLVDEYGGGEAFQALELATGSLPRDAGVVTYSPEFASLE